MGCLHPSAQDPFSPTDFSIPKLFQGVLAMRGVGKPRPELTSSSALSCLLVFRHGVFLSLCILTSLKLEILLRVGIVSTGRINNLRPAKGVVLDSKECAPPDGGILGRQH